MVHHLQHMVDLIEICRLKGFVHAVISPGSRNAPIIRALVQQPQFRLYSIVDERSAGYFALGLSLSLQQPVLLVCTSGTAVLNYGPALAEAYYQHVPLLAITADRPEELIGQQDNQTINQLKVFHNYTKGFLQLLRPALTEYQAEVQNQKINSFLDMAVAGIKGPVHFNVPIDEPLYTRLPEPSTEIICPAHEPTLHGMPDELVLNWNRARRRMIICGQGRKNDKLNFVLNRLATQNIAVVFAEPIANVQGESILNPVDRILMGLEETELETLKPDLLVSFGGAIISKRLKNWLRQQPALTHYRIAPEEDGIDTYQNLTATIVGREEEVLEKLFTTEVKTDDAFVQNWKAVWTDSDNKMRKILTGIAYSDLLVFDQIIKALPQGCILHLGNSSSVRYAQWFDLTPCKMVLSNRGVSGIDGCLSTAVGYATQSDDLNVLIMGDLSFVYDSNGLWNRNLPKNLRIIVINNQGGGIFRMLSGPSEQVGFDDFMEAFHPVSIRKLSESFGLNYLNADRDEAIETGLSFLFAPQTGTAVLEIETPRLRNAVEYAEFVKNMKKQDK